MLRVQNLNFSYGKNQILKNLDFTVDPGSHLSIIGESGSGKSTLLKLLYGEYDLNEGAIHWKDQEILGPKSNLVVGYDFMKYVAQEYELMPFTTVAENVGTFLSNFYKEEKKERIAELLEVVELSAIADRKVKTLSGGQKQRVALAKAMAKKPEIILLDEPFSHIDNFKKQSLRRQVFNYLKSQEITCIVATHDHEDVLGYADQMMVLHDKQIVAHQPPKELYHQPINALVASFFGEFNTIDSKLIYAHQLKLTDQSHIAVKIVRSYFKGSHYLIESTRESQTIFFHNSEALDAGDMAYLEITPK